MTVTPAASIPGTTCEKSASATNAAPRWSLLKIPTYAGPHGVEQAFYACVPGKEFDAFRRWGNCGDQPMRKLISSRFIDQVLQRLSRQIPLQIRGEHLI